MNAVSPTITDPTKIRDAASAVAFLRSGIEKGDGFRDISIIDFDTFTARFNELGRAIGTKDKAQRTAEERVVFQLMGIQANDLRRMSMAVFKGYLTSAQAEQTELSSTFAETESAAPTPDVENDDFSAILSIIPSNTSQNIRTAQNLLPSRSRRERETRAIILGLIELKHQCDNRIVTTNPMLRQQNNQRQAEAAAKLSALSEALNAEPQALSLIRETVEQLNEAIDAPLPLHYARTVDRDERPRPEM